jgi:hypothetical protein
MSTSKRIAIVLASLAVGVLVTRLADVPRVVAQAKAALVRSVDEPARVPYFISAQPTCPFLNECYVTGPVVPAGKRVRVTRLEGVLFGVTQDTFAALELNDTNHPVLMFPFAPFSGAFFGNVVSFSQEVDFNLEAGETPIIDVGNTGSIPMDSRNQLTIVGYEVDLTP